MDHAGDGRPAPVFDIRRCPGDGSGGRNAPKERRGGVTHTLGHQLHVGVMPGADHLVGHYGGQQGLNGRQHGDGKGVRQHRRNGAVGHRGQSKFRQGAGNRIEVPNGVDRQRQQLRRRRPHHGGKGGGNLPEDPGPEHQHRQGQASHPRGGGVHRMKGTEYLLQLLHGLHRGILEGQAEEILQLADEDGNRDARSKARSDGIGDELNHAAHPQDAHQNQHQARQNRGGGKALHAIPGHNARHDSSKGCGGAGNLDLAPAQGRNQEARGNGGIKPLLRGHAGGQRQRDGQRQGDDGHDDSSGQVLEQVLFRIVLKGVNQLGGKLFHMRVSFFAGADARSGPLRRRLPSIIARSGRSYKAIFLFLQGSLPSPRLPREGQAGRNYISGFWLPAAVPFRLWDM